MKNFEIKADLSNIEVLKEGYCKEKLDVEIEIVKTINEKCSRYTAHLFFEGDDEYVTTENADVRYNGKLYNRIIFTIIIEDNNTGIVSQYSHYKKNYLFWDVPEFITFDNFDILSYRKKRITTLRGNMVKQSHKTIDQPNYFSLNAISDRKLNSWFDYLKLIAQEQIDINNEENADSEILKQYVSEIEKKRKIQTKFSANGVECVIYDIERGIEYTVFCCNKEVGMSYSITLMDRKKFQKFITE